MVCRDEKDEDKKSSRFGQHSDGGLAFWERGGQA